jgi:hypothetical protein
MSSIEKRKLLFKDVRDLEYHIAIDGEADSSCATKSFLLQRRLASLGIGSVFAYGTYSWRQLQLPVELLELLPGDEAWHQWLRVFIPETQTWVDLDASWDVGLGQLFTIADWDGLSSTAMAVPLVRRCTDEENASISGNGYQPALVATYMQTYRPFLSALNNYLTKVRQRQD